ncbi:hypothetical protein MKX01_028164 [Papaver californicum]|nr:hypothetical protein MKX01_028164 [Papaver californicum]
MAFPYGSHPVPLLNLVSRLVILDEQKSASVAYISLGTVATPPPHELAALEEGLEKVGTPQEQVLGHDAIGVFVTHGGCNSVVESITAGVPMICRPSFGDHKIIFRMISDVWGVGTSIKDGVFTKDGTMKCLDMIFSEGKLRTRAGTLRTFAKHALGPEGTTTKNFNTLAEIVCRD